MILTDEEAREIIEAMEIASSICGEEGFDDDVETLDRLITLLESRLGVEDELTAAYQFGFERGKDFARKERG